MVLSVPLYIFPCKRIVVLQVNFLNTDYSNLKLVHLTRAKYEKSLEPKWNDFPTQKTGTGHDLDMEYDMTLIWNMTLSTGLDLSLLCD